MREATCEKCGKTFTRRMIRHRFCSTDCQQWAAGRRRDRTARATPAPCAIDGCDKQRRSHTAAWCEMHYGRWRRNGDPTALLQPRPLYLHSNGYVMARLPEHPLANDQGYVYQHRQVLFDAIGPGAHPCHWCGLPIEWGYTLEADHCDNNRSNNAPVNIVPSCHSCNSGRGTADNVELWAMQIATKRLQRDHQAEWDAHMNRVVEEHTRRTEVSKA